MLVPTEETKRERERGREGSGEEEGRGEERKKEGGGGEEGEEGKEEEGGGEREKEKLSAPFKENYLTGSPRKISKYNNYLAFSHLPEKSFKPIQFL